VVEINQYLSNPEVDIIIFDSAEVLAVTISTLNFGTPRIIVLSTWGITPSQYDNIQNHIRLHQTTFCLTKSPLTYTWHNFNIPMSHHQLLYYDRVRTLESFGEHTLSEVIGTYVYPDNIMKKLLRVNMSCGIAAQTSDVYGKAGTWISSGAYDTLSECGPKIEACLDNVISRWPERQVIYVKYGPQFGVDLIVSLLQIMRQRNISPYENRDIVASSCGSEVPIDNFSILVTNSIPSGMIYNVSVIHVLSPYDFLVFRSLLNHIVPRKTLDIVTYISTHPNGESADLKAYQVFDSQRTGVETLYNNQLNINSRMVSHMDHLEVDLEVVQR
jgi:hypothetical protein